MMNRWTAALAIALLSVYLTHQAHAHEAKESEGIAEPQPQSIVEALLFFPTKFPTGDWEPKDLRFKAMETWTERSPSLPKRGSFRRQTNQNNLLRLTMLITTIGSPMPT